MVLGVDAAQSQPVARQNLTELGIVGSVWKGRGYRMHSQLSACLSCPSKHEG